MAKRKQTVSKRKPRKRRKKKISSQTSFAIGALLILLIAFLFYFFLFFGNKRNVFHSFDQSPYSAKYEVRGVDVSHHNSFINWNELRKESVTFAYLKSTEGVGHKDRDYRKNYRLAKEAGLKVGTYHFYTFGMDGKKQAQHFIRNSIIKSGDMIPAIDVEHSSINKSCKTDADLQKMLKELRALEKRLHEHYGKRPVIYTNKDCYRQYIENNFPDNPLWICDLHNEPDVASDKWVIWQFSHTGQISGVVNDIDLNYYRNSFGDFRNLLIP